MKLQKTNPWKFLSTAMTRGLASCNCTCAAWILNYYYHIMILIAFRRVHVFPTRLKICQKSAVSHSVLGPTNPKERTPLITQLGQTFFVGRDLRGIGYRTSSISSFKGAFICDVCNVCGIYHLLLPLVYSSQVVYTMRFAQHPLRCLLFHQAHPSPWTS